MATDAAQGPGVEGAWHHRALDDRPAARCPPSRAWPCWGTALPPALPAAAGPRSTPPRSPGDATPPMAQDKAPLAPAATLPLVAVTQHQPPACALEPARACFHSQPHRCQSLGPPRRPRTPERARAAPPARTGSAVGTGDRPTTAADRT